MRKKMKEIKCKKCLKSIYGFTEKQLMQQLQQHILARHGNELNLNLKKFIERRK